MKMINYDTDYFQFIGENDSIVFAKGDWDDEMDNYEEFEELEEQSEMDEE